MENFLGIDIGGTNVKLGLVNSEGELLEKRKIATADLKSTGSFIRALFNTIKEDLNKYTEVKRVGIGIPGMLSKDRSMALELANLSELNNFPLLKSLQDVFPKHAFKLENDANAAALGEYYFGQTKLWESFLFVTLGTGVGAAAVIDGKLFLGADGNAMEMGHIICSKGTTLEEQIGKAGLIKKTMALLALEEYEDSKLQHESPIGSKKLLKAALENDPLALDVLQQAGALLGEGIATSIRMLDVKKIYIGGGISNAYSQMEKSVWQSLERYLPKYYLDDIEIKPATLGNNAGIVGAASLCFI